VRAGWLLYAAASVLGLGSGLGSGLVMTLGTDLAPQNPAERGYYLALFRIITDSGILLGSVRDRGIFFFLMPKVYFCASVLR
jgi:MFS family permease